MKKTLRVANILSWFNLLFWGINLVTTLFLLGLNPVFLVVIVLVASIPLHSYAALQLHKSIRRPETKLSHQTPAGIRFVGIIALFFGLGFVLFGIIMAKYAHTLLNMSKEQGLMKELYSSVTDSDIRWGGIKLLGLGLITIVNVILNMRLLRWYYLVHQSDAS